LTLAMHDLEFSLAAITDETSMPCGIQGIFTSPIELFTESQAQRLAALFVDILRDLAQNPEKMPIQLDLPRCLIDEGDVVQRNGREKPGFLRRLMHDGTKV
jgi:hypothetical protein